MMSNTEFGVSVSDELVEELDDLTEQCVDLQASRSEVVEAILTAYFQGDIDHEARVRELIIRRRKGSSDLFSSCCSRCNGF